MRVSEIIEYVNMVDPNQFDTATKIGWLSDLDAKVFETVILTHEHEECIEYLPYTQLDDELLIKEPYAKDCYEPYLRAKMSAANLEAVRYNQHMAMFNGAYQVFTNYYNRTHRPLAAAGGNRFRF